MNEITPDLVARIASRIYNEKPDAATPHAATGATGDLQATSLPGISATPHVPLGALPREVEVPGAAGLPSLPALASRGKSLVSAPPIPQQPVPQFSEQLGLSHPSMPNPHLTTPGIPAMPAVGAAPLPATIAAHNSAPQFGGLAHGSGLPSDLSHSGPLSTSSLQSPGHSSTPQFSGIRGFVQKIRQTHTASELHGFAQPQAHLREQLSLGRVFPSQGARPLDVPAIRKEFPILQQRVHGSRWPGLTTRPPRKSRKA